MYTFIGRPSVNYRSTINRLLVDSRLIVDRYIDRLSADASADMCTFIDRLSADISVHCRPIYRSTVARSIGPLSTDSRSTVDMATEATYSTHDPVIQ